MGCDIHIITQIKKEKKWEYVPEIPKTLNDRNYFNFAILAGVRNDFDTKGFSPKGLPKDLGEKKIGWKSSFEKIKSRFENGGIECCKLPNGKYISGMDDSLKMYCTREEYEKFNGCKGCEQGQYYVYDCSVVNGVFVNVPYKERYSFEEFLDKHYRDEYNEELKDYGEYAIDFNDCGEHGDLHTPSYLTLRELLDFDYSDILKDKVKVSKNFMTAFFKFGGELPKEMKLSEWEPSDIRSCFQEAISPTYIISWDKYKKEDILFFEDVKEIEEIAKKYGITDFNNIRIVFAFDN